MLSFNEAVEELESGSEVNIECNGYAYTIGPADSFIGGDGQGGYISEILGNVIYDSAERILKESIKDLNNNYYITL